MEEIITSLQIKISIPQDKKMTVGNIATAVKGMKIEQKVAEEIIKAIDKKETTRYAGKPNTRGNGEKRYQRAGTKNRHPITSIGRLSLKLHLLKDTQKKGNNTFRPIENRIEFSGKKTYQEDISMISAELATKMTYRDAETEGKLFLEDMPSASTINRRVIFYGEKIKEYNSNKIKDASLDIAFADATKCHSQEKDKNKNGVNVALGLDRRGEKMLLDARVNQAWDETAKYLDDLKALDYKATLVGDGDVDMKNALVTGERGFQMDLIHASRGTGYRLWKDSKLSLEDRRAVIGELEAALYTLKNSVYKHLKDGDTGALRRRIDCTVDALKKLAKRLWKMGCFLAADFIRKYSNAVVTFARLAADGRIVPWNSNIIERLMGEISKRCKHKWMRWTTRGLEAILNLILVRYTSEESYENFKEKMMKTDNLRFIKSEVKIVSAGGEL